MIVAKTAPNSKTSLAYRADIDGLRAVAVISVVLFHFHAPFIKGGFVGVDVFFVISGYLISSIIMREMREERFSIVKFYERRVRRIFPAMLAMMFVVTGAVFYLFPPPEVRRFAQTLLAALYSGSNFIFWHQADYFDVDSQSKPLLHTWSLAVEEQFYLLLPPLLILLKRFAPSRIKSAIFTLFGLSFVAAALSVAHDSTPAFYFAPLRAWELLIGTILSQHYLPSIRRQGTRDMASLLGLFLILLPVFLYDGATPFPGLTALPPCLGAALLIAAGEEGPAIGGKILSWPPIVFVGLISYSLYLWHWPIAVAQAMESILVPDRFAGKHITLLVLLLISLAAAVLSWAFVESPVRKPSVTRRALFVWSAGSVALLTVVAIALIVSRGAPQRYPSDVV